MSTTSNTPADLYEHLKFLTGQDNLTETAANRLFKYAIDDYSAIAMDSDGVQKFDDSSYDTYPVYTATVDSSNPKIELDDSFLQIDRVEIDVSDGSKQVLKAIDRRDFKNDSLSSVFGSSGLPTAYDIDGNGIEMWPHPDQSYTVTVYPTRAAQYIDVTDDLNVVGLRRTHHYYLILHCCRQLGFRTIDSNRTDIAAELVKWEGQMVNGRMTGGKIRHDFQRRDEDRPRRLRVKSISTNSFKTR